MSTEIVQNTPEEVFRKEYSWISEFDMTENNLVVNRFTVPVDSSGWYREHVQIGTLDHALGKIDHNLIVETVNTFNRHGLPVDSQVVILHANKAGSQLRLSLAMAFGIVSCKKSPGINVHFEKNSSLVNEEVNIFLAHALGLKSSYQIELERYAGVRNFKKS